MSVVSQIKHYQQSIEKCSNNESRLLHCIEKLYKLPVTVQHLQDTGVGRTVNALRKYEGTVGDASKALVAKWKTMVVDEESSEAEDEDDPNPPEIPEPPSDNSDGETHSRNYHRSRDQQPQESKSRSSDSRSRDSARSDQERKSSKESKDSRDSKNSRDKRDKDREKERTPREDKTVRVKSKDRQEHKSHKSLKSPKNSPNSSKPSKENKEINGSENSRKRKHESNNSKRISKSLNSSAEENSDDDEVSVKSQSPEITQSIPKESKREKHREKSRSSEKSRVERSDKKSGKPEKSEKLDKPEKLEKLERSEKSAKLNSGEHESRHKSSRSESKEKKSSSSKSKRHKSKSPEKKKMKKHLNGDEGIDCNSGATFAEALGMCSAPVRKKPVSPSSPVIKGKSEATTSTSRQKIKTETPKDEGPSLLSPNVKLEPLSVDLASTLPEISANYKPLPVNNYHNSVHRKMEEDRALNDAIYAKNMRTKVYSGNKCGYTSVPSLYDLCIRVLIENIDALEATGGVPFDILKPVLEKAMPDQLFMLEHHNPYLIEETDALWQFHCNREFRNKQREEMESFREMYMRCLDEREAKLKTLTANIKQSIDKSVPVRSAKLAFVDNIVKPPRNVLRKQAKYGTCSTTSASDAKKKIITAAHSASNISVPAPPVGRVRTSSAIVKKSKAPLMAKALQLIKGRYKR